MTSFDFDLSEKELAGADHVMRVGRQLVAAFVRKARKEKISKAELARRLDLDKAAITRMLRGNTNLTLRSVGELCWAMGIHPDVKLYDDPQPVERTNHPRFNVTPAAAATALMPQRLQVTAQ